MADQTYNVSQGTGQRIPKVAVSVTGSWLNLTWTFTTPTVTISAGQSAASMPVGTAGWGGSWMTTNLLVTAAPALVTVGVSAGFSAVMDSGGNAGSGFILGPGSKANWLKWSNIGALDFTIYKDNLAGERPLDWKGTIWALKWRGDKIVAYGQNGVSVLTPAGNAFGLETLSRKGLRSKQAMAATRDAHFFIDKDAQLWELNDTGLHYLNYSEYLSALVSPVLSWDPVDNLLYLCDGTTGFVYHPATHCLAQGPATVSGVGVQDGTRYIVAPVSIVIPNFEITTDIYDMGTRSAKTIQSIEAGVNTPGTLQVSIEFRQHLTANFLQTNWYTMDSRGVRYLNCYGYEFRFHLKQLSADWFRLDHLTVNGHVHDH